MLLQSVLIGKARSAYTQLSIDQSADYKIVKNLILQSYELIPEAYRQKFRKWEKPNDLTYVEFSRTKEKLFDRWCNPTNVNGNFDNLRHLILLEDFKNCISSGIRAHIDEQNAPTLDAAARMADEYALSHKTNFSVKFKQSFFKG